MRQLGPTGFLGIVLLNPDPVVLVGEGSEARVAEAFGPSADVSEGRHGGMLEHGEPDDLPDLQSEDDGTEGSYLSQAAEIQVPFMRPPPNAKSKEVTACS